MCRQGHTTSRAEVGAGAERAAGVGGEAGAVGVMVVEAAGVKVAGCTVHQVELAVDSGPVVMQAAVPVEPGDTPATLQARIQVQEHRIYPAAIALAAAEQSGL